jgi:hypothetical protein
MSGSVRAGDSLVKGHIEGLSREMLEDDACRKILNDYVKDRCGLYALYKDDRLKYVGLAADLPVRLNAHLKNRPRDSWNRFSVFLTRDEEHIRELETLVIGIAKPVENKICGRLRGSENLQRKMQRDLAEFHKNRRRVLFGYRQKTPKPAADEPLVPPRTSRAPQLARYTTRSFRIRLKHMGVVHKAVVQRDGTILHRGVVYTSPSIAGARIIGRRSLNGWKAWKYENERGEWVTLDELRTNSKNLKQHS